MALRESINTKAIIIMVVLLFIIAGIWFIFAWNTRNKNHFEVSEPFGSDYLLHIVSLGSNTGYEEVQHAPLPAIRFLGPGITKGKLDYAGVRPVLDAMIGNDHIFRSAYIAFLEEAFENNRRLALLNGTDFFVPTGHPGSENFALAIKAGGGIIDPEFLIDDIGYSWKTMYNSALNHAYKALQEGGVIGKPKELARLKHLIAIGMLSAIGNRLLPMEYVKQWSEQNQKLLTPIVERLRNDKSGDEKDKAVRESLVYQLPWLFHATGMPRPPWGKNELARYYDSFHFFSYAWYGAYSLYRKSYWGRFRGFKYHNVRRFSANVTILKSIFVGLSFESISAILYKHGFFELKAINECDGLMADIVRKFGIEKMPFYEAFDDLRMDREGCIFGCAVFMEPQTKLDPTDFDLNHSVMYKIGSFGLWELLIISFVILMIGIPTAITYLFWPRKIKKKKANIQ